MNCIDNISCELVLHSKELCARAGVFKSPDFHELVADVLLRVKGVTGIAMSKMHCEYDSKCMIVIVPAPAKYGDVVQALIGIHSAVSVPAACFYQACAWKETQGRITGVPIHISVDKYKEHSENS